VAEVIAMQLIYALGYIGKYNVGQVSACQLNNPMVQLYRVNEFLQLNRRKRVAPGPLLGQDGEPDAQPLNKLKGLVMSYPEYLDLNNKMAGAKVRLKDGTFVNSLHQALLDGKFHEIDWRSIGRKHEDGYVKHISDAREVWSSLVDMDPKGDSLKTDVLSFYRDKAEKVLKGVGYSDREAEWWAARLSLLNIIGTIVRHDPRLGSEGVGLAWTYLSITARISDIDSYNNRIATVRGGVVKPILPVGPMTDIDGKTWFFEGKKLTYIDYIRKYYLNNGGLLNRWSLAEQQRAPAMRVTEVG
jgi:hypothetical protein